MQNETFEYKDLKRNLPAGITSLDYKYEPVKGNVWSAWNEDTVIGQFWHRDADTFSCWAVRDAVGARVRLDTIPSCLAYIASRFYYSKSMDDSARAALLSILKD